MEKREFEGMEDAILEAEAHLDEARAAMNNPAVASQADKLAELHQDLTRAEAEVERLYARWSELDSKRKGTPKGASSGTSRRLPKP
jgi:ATP-binding cassette subfamily F protein uup